MAAAPIYWPELLRRGARHSSGLVEFAIAMKNDIKPGVYDRRGALFVWALERLHRHVVAQDEAVEPDLAAHDLRDHDRRRRRRMTLVNRRIEDVRAHRHRQVIQRRKGRKIAFEGITRGVDNGQLVMAVGARPAMPRHVLDNGRDAAREKPLGDRSTHRGDALWLRREGPAADGGVGFRPGDIEYRRTIDGDPNFGQIESDKPGD